jgi:hypothetical protein
MNFAGVTGVVALAFYAKTYLHADLFQLSLITFLGAMPSTSPSARC